MKKLAPILALPLLVLACQDADQLQGPDSPRLSAVSGPQAHVIVLLDRSLAPGPHGANQAAAAELAHEFDVRPEHSYGTAVFGFSAHLPQAVAERLRADPRVTHVEPVEERTFAVQDLPTGVDRIETDKNPSADIDGTDDVRVALDVAIIDSGIDGDHPDLNVAGGHNTGGGASSDWEDGNGHGTHVAGTVGAIDNGQGVVGVAPGAPVWAVKVCKNGGICLTSDIVAGIDWVAAEKAEAHDGDGDPGVDFAAANMSITTSDEDFTCDSTTDNPGAVHRAICGLVAEGVVFSLAAGNDNREKAAYPEVLAVSAIADFDGQGGGAASPTCRTDTDDTRANFSNHFSSTTETPVAAPGTCIRSTWVGGGYNTISGTSMAAPHAAGAVALYLHANGLSPATDGTGVDDIEAAILGAALDQSHECGYANDAADESTEGLLFVNATSFGGDGSCAVATTSSNDAPTVSWVNPTDGETVSGTVVTIQIDASDTEDEAGTLTVEWRVDDGTWQTAAYNSETGYYEDSWDTTAESDGDHTLTAEATDGEGATTSASISVTVDNGGDGGSSSSDMYVWSIDFSQKDYGPGGSFHDIMPLVTIQQDSDGDGTAESSDDPAADASVALTLTHDTDGDGAFECGTDDDCWNFSGSTDTNGQIEFTLKRAPTGDYQAEVTDLTHATFTWNASLDADNPDTYTLQ